MINEQRIARAIVDPIIGGGGHGQMAPGHVGLGDRAFPVIGAHVSVERTGTPSAHRAAPRVCAPAPRPTARHDAARRGARVRAAAS